MPFFLTLSKASRSAGFVALAGAIGFGVGFVAFGFTDSRWLVEALSDTPGPVVGVVMGIILALAASTLTSIIVITRVRAKYRLIRSALNNMTQGLCMFDGAARLILRNERYIEMYHLRPEHAQRGTPLRDLLIERTAAGTFRGRPGRLRRRVPQTGHRWPHRNEDNRNQGRPPHYARTYLKILSCYRSAIKAE
jgi:PAS domain-containing protein